MTEAAHPLAPVDLPEFGHAVSWAMCRNPRCENFCIHYEGPSPEGEGDTVQDARYRIQDGRLRCKYCGQSFSLKSNRADPAACPPPSSRSACRSPTAPTRAA